MKAWKLWSACVFVSINMSCGGGDNLGEAGSGYALGDKNTHEFGELVQSVGTPPVSMQACVSDAPCTMPLISAGGSHTVALKSDGTVRGWGGNYSGELGDGTNTDRSQPVRAEISSGAALANVSAVAAGRNGYTVALRADGTVWAWGRNIFGQLGDGTNTDRSRPIQVEIFSGVAFSNVVAVSAGGEHTVALRADGTVWTWGNSTAGLFAGGVDRNSTGNNRPVQVRLSSGGAFSNMIAVAAGEYHTVALRADGTVWTWGYNFDGQLGDGTTTSSAWPIQVVAPSGTGHLSNVIAVAAGGIGNTVALRADGTVWAWGRNSDGQLGDGTRTNRTRPVQVLAPSSDTGYLSNIIAIAAGSNNHTVALREDGTVWAWGSNMSSKLVGYGTMTNSLRPVQVRRSASEALVNIVAVAAGSEHTVALDVNGTVWAWGRNMNGQLGNGTMTDSPWPVQSNHSWLSNACASIPICSGGACIFSRADRYGYPACTTSCQSSTTCSGHGTCNASGGCSCDTGFGGANCNQCAAGFSGYPSCCQDATTCNGNGTCSTTGDCICNPGFLGPKCQYSDAITCNGHGTVDKNGSCSCNTGFEGMRCDRCMIRFIGYPSCSQCATDYYNYPACTFCWASSTCNGEGTCNASGICECRSGLLGPNCQYSNATTCNDHGTVDNNGNCTCYSDHSGPACQYSNATTCSGHGSVQATGICVCDFGYGGSRCQCNEATGVCACEAQTSCNGHGDCDARGECVCAPSFGGISCNQCATHCYNYPSCTYCQDSTTCNGHGSCNARGGCTCASSFAGTNCNQCANNHYNYPSCTYCQALTTCNGHGICNASGGCACSSGFVGANCQYSDVYTCSGHGSAQATGSCTCLPGYGGERCQCSEATGGCACEDSATCNDNGRCDAKGSCVCASGFGGPNCNECAAGYSGYPNCTYDDPPSTTCNGHGTVDSNGSCVCNEGFGGLNCNECAAGYSGYPNCTQGDGETKEPLKQKKGGCAASGNTPSVGLGLALSLLLLARLRRRALD